MCKVICHSSVSILKIFLDIYLFETTTDGEGETETKRERDIFHLADGRAESLAESSVI